MSDEPLMATAASPPRKTIRSLVAFTGTYLAVAAIGAMATGNTEFLFYIAVMLVLIVAVWVVHRGVCLSTATLWALSAWGLAHMAGGLVTVPDSWPVSNESAVLYTLWLVPERLKYDQIVHAYGFGVTTWVCWQGLRAALSARGGTVEPTFGLMVLSAAAGLGFGALNEVVEFVAVLLVPETNVGGYVNTGWDLVANGVGAVVAAALIWLSERRRPSPL
jgi:hypothetical protein